MPTVQEIQFQKWWHDIGSGIVPLPDDDYETHAKRVAMMAYCAGSHQADSKIARIKELREALADLIDTACRCDGWEFFPSDAIESAQAALRP